VGLCTAVAFATAKECSSCSIATNRFSFWMKNTKLPLSLAYTLSDGTIVQILDLVPFSEEPRPSSRSIRYALEVPQGWFARVGIQVGDKVQIPSLQ